MSAPNFWEDQNKANAEISKLKGLKGVTKAYDDLTKIIDDLQVALEFASEDESDDEMLREAEEMLGSAQKQFTNFELLTLFNDEHDHNNAFLIIQAGSGGTEAQDWAEMLMRMFLLYTERKGFKNEIIDVQKNDEAGIKYAQILIKGDLAFGLLKGERGVHRLVRVSPFDANSRRHTSFASVDVLAEIKDDINIQIDPSDLRIDTFCASGKGGQHVNRTESAVRITHLPTNVVVSCQNERSQHHNKDTAMKMLKAKLYQIEKSKKEAEAAKLYNEKGEISWGNQIRSYVLDDSRVKDHRTNVESHNPTSILNGDIDIFIENYHRWRKSLEKAK